LSSFLKLFVEFVGLLVLRASSMPILRRTLMREEDYSSVEELGRSERGSMVWRLPEVSGHRRVLIMAMRAMKV